ncbi:hypothetical protein LGM58_35650 [Burkholderia contaminans]|uniref:hypothetical protein n=1 Tax=Burkholderia contaminans TaxID=488447 RepID=UPI001CF33095|nr:hypothetical protein [Burkholderia contaminans]MCA7888519.1 hypothetical protein [Burkholderia contaminans]
MSEVQERPVSRSQDAFELEGRTVAEVARYLEQSLRATELEPEWVTVANHFDDANEAIYGPKRSSAWPGGGDFRRRTRVSIERGTAEGWIVLLDSVWLADEEATGHWRTQPLIRIKTLTRSHGWAVAVVVSNLLDID